MLCALDAIVSLLEVIRKAKMKKTRLVEREKHTPETLGAWEKS